MSDLTEIAAELRKITKRQRLLTTDAEVVLGRIDALADRLDAAAKEQAAELYEAHQIAQRDNDALLAQAAEIDRLRETIERIKERATAGAKQFRYATDYTVILDLIEDRIPELKGQA